MEDVKNIKKFCKTLNPLYLDKLSLSSQSFFIDLSYSVLNQKIGKQEIAYIVLNHFNEVIKVDDYFVYKGDYKEKGYQSLKRCGVVTIPILEKDEIDDYRLQFKDTIKKFPEYLRQKDNVNKDGSNNPLVYVLGGFAALGNPGSFHNKFVRDLRLKSKEKVKPLFRQFISNIIDKEIRDNSKLELLPGRMLYRLKSQAPSAESWHRDVSDKETLDDNDVVFGGWINLDKTDQYFSCIPGSHLGISQKSLRSGFSTVPKSKIGAITKHKIKFKCPPGHIIIFPQYILHEVVSSKAKDTVMRLSTEWRITIKDTFMHPNMEELLRTQGIMPTGSSQQPPMYSSNHGSLFLRKQFRPVNNMPTKVNLIEWSKNTFRPETLVEKEGKDGRKYTIVSRFMKSLEFYGFKKYPEYSEEEINEYKPQRIQ
jgi:hypothetical protein